MLLFGSNGIIAARISLPSSQIVLLRTLIGSLLLTAIFLLTGRRFTFWKHRRQFLFLVLSGAAMGARWMCLYEAYRQVGVGIASLTYYCGPVIVMALSPLLFHERLTGTKAAGFLAVLIGVFLVTGRVVQSGGGSWGLLCGGLSAVLYALMVIFNKKAAEITGLENAVLQLLTGFLTVAAFVGFRRGFSIPITGRDWAPVLILGLLNTGVGCYLYFSSIIRLPVQTVAVCGYLEPLSAVLFSVLLLGETMRPGQLAGAALILGGAVWSECRGAGKTSEKPCPR